MYNLNFLFSFYMILISCFLLFYYLKHLLMILISFEFIMISVYYNLFMLMMNIEINMFILMFFLIMGVCEGALGLSLIVLIVRFYGNDYLNSLSLMVW